MKYNYSWVAKYEKEAIEDMKQALIRMILAYKRDEI